MESNISTTETNQLCETCFKSFQRRRFAVLAQLIALTFADPIDRRLAHAPSAAL